MSKYPDPRQSRVFLSCTPAEVVVHVWLAIVFVGCILSFGSSHSGWAYTDKVLHAFLYAVPMAILVFFHHISVRWLLYLVLFGVIVEAIQYILPYRSAEFADVLANCFGLMLGWSLGKGLAYIRRHVR